MEIHRVALLSRSPLKFRNVVFCRGGKTGVPGEKLSEQGQEPIANSIHICRRVRDSNYFWATLVGGECSPNIVDDNLVIILWTRVQSVFQSVLLMGQS